MNGNARLGILYAIFGGSLTAQGVDGLSDNVWTGIGIIVLGVMMTIAAFSQVDKGIKESIRISELQKAVKNTR